MRWQRARVISAKRTGGSMSADERNGVGGSVDPSVEGAGRATWRRLAVDLREAGAMMDVSGKTVKRLIFRGELKGLKVGAQWRVRVAAIEEYLERGEQQRGMS
jgi:excisionase family DNA binding protein